ncbi:MAG: helix-turn-helix transcriptional regulator [Spirochaetaceae bacterium]|nr:helix-turn-helix transcriptional regulator [Spirochaetaceae bacterium]
MSVTKDTGCVTCPCDDFCPLESALRLIGGRWKIPILCALRMGGTARYNDLKRKVRGITNTMLASSLRELEEAGLVSRTQYSEMPVRVEYALTGACEDLLPTLMNFAVWGKKMHKEE